MTTLFYFELGLGNEAGIRCWFRALRGASQDDVLDRRMKKQNSETIDLCGRVDSSCLAVPALPCGRLGISGGNKQAGNKLADAASK